MPRPRDEWYSKFVNNMKSEMEINIYNPDDIKRLRIPDPDNGGTKPLFENGLKNTVEEKNLLYQYAQEGKLFVFQKETNNPYQVTDKGIYSCQKEDEKEKASIGQKVGYEVIKRAWGIPRFGLGVVGRVFNLLTGDIFKSQVAALGKGLDMMTSAWSERLFSVNAQNEAVGIGDRIGNFLTAGTYQKDKIATQKRENELYEERDKIRAVLNQEKDEWLARDLQAEENRKFQEEKTQREKELETLKKQQEELENNKNKEIVNENENKLNQQKENVNEKKEQNKEEIQNVNENKEQNKEEVVNENENEKEQQQQQIDNNDNIGNNDDKPNDVEKDVKTEIMSMYEKIQLAFMGPDSLMNATKTAQDMNKLLEELKSDPDKAAKSGLSEFQIKGYSHLCTNLEKITTEGLEAKSQLMNDNADQLTKEAREQCICKVQLMTLVENAMVNFALNDLAQKQNPKEAGAKTQKYSELFKQMHKSNFQDTLLEKMNMLDSTKEMLDMSPEALAKVISEPSKIRQAHRNEIHNVVEQANIEQKQMERQHQLENQPKNPQLEEPNLNPM